MRTINTRTKYKIVGSDYSGQELRLATFLSQDPKLLEAYENNIDAYAMIAQMVFGCPYDDCLEFYPAGKVVDIDGQKVITGNGKERDVIIGEDKQFTLQNHETVTTANGAKFPNALSVGDLISSDKGDIFVRDITESDNVYTINVDGSFGATIHIVSATKVLNMEGKERRGIGKILVLAGNYGMAGASAGALMNKTAKEGTELLEKYFQMFGGLKSAIDRSRKFLREHGYVEDLKGRRRHLSDYFLPPYEVFYEDVDKQENLTFNPFLRCENRAFADPKLKTYLDRVSNARGSKEVDKISKEAYKEGIIVKSNTGKIAQAERQCFNSVIQGSAGTLTKTAMIDIYNDPIMKECDTHLLLTIHDEVLVECKAEYADIVEKRLPEIMILAAEKLGVISPKMKCDPCVVDRWYADNMAGTLLKEFNKLKSKGKSRDEAMDAIIKRYPEFPMDAVIKTLETGCDLAF